MTFLYRFGMLSALFATTIAFHASAAGVTVTRQGFCARKSETGCADVILPDTIIDIARLPKGADGKPVVYFYSLQKVDSKAMLIHVLESEEAPDNVAYRINPEDKAHAAGLESALKTAVKKLTLEGDVVVTPFQLTAESGPAMSEIAVTGPGKLHASIVDLKGNPIPASTPVSINVMQRNR